MKNMREPQSSLMSDEESRRYQHEILQKVLSGQMKPEELKPKELSSKEKEQRELEKREFLTKAKEKQADEWTKVRHVFLAEFGRDAEDMTPAEVDLYIKVYLQKMDSRIKSTETAFANVLSVLFKK